MPVKVCLHCTQLHRLGEACPNRPPNATSWNGQRSRTAQAKFRREVLRRAGNQCQAVTGGRRCTITTSLQAHHTQPGNDDPATGVALCRPHHKLLDAHAR